MQGTILQITLFALKDLPRVWGRFDHQRPTDATIPMLIVAGSTILVVVATWIWFLASRRQPSQFAAYRPAKLFRELCRAHGLAYSKRRLLKRLAAARGLANPAILFVEPGYFETGSLPGELRSRADEVRHLRARLFN